MKTELIELNLTRFKNIAGKLMPGVPIELKLIEYYKFIQTEKHCTINLFTQHVLQYMYKDTLIREYSDINIFFKEKIYNNVVLTFLELLEIFILNKINPYFVDIIFIEYKKHDTDLIVVFKVTKVNHEHDKTP